MLRILLITVASMLLLGGPAGAQPSPADKKAAKAAFEAAEAAERRKDWRTAIEEYQHAYDLVPHPNALYNIAVDFERLEEYRDAATYYRRYLDETDDDSERKRIEALIDKLRARPAQVKIQSEPSGASIEIDGKRAGQAPVEVKLSGTHEVVVSDGATSTSRTVVVEFGEPQAITIPLVARAGTLIISSNVPGAQVLIDDVFVGTIPFGGQVTAGPHRVVVTAEGWSSYERAIEVHPEGSSQMTANLVRPLGFVEPVATTPTEPRGYILAGGGADASGAIPGGMYLLLFGAHRGRFDGGLGYGVMSEGAGFALEVRVALTTGRIRPYLRTAAMLGTTSTLTGHVGVMGTVSQNGRAQTAVFIDVGGGIANNGTDETRSFFVPVIAGFQIAY